MPGVLFRRGVLWGTSLPLDQQLREAGTVTGTVGLVGGGSVLAACASEPEVGTSAKRVRVDGDVDRALLDDAYAIAANVRAGRKNAVTTAGLTQGAGFAGIQGAFRLRPDGSNQRQLSVATLQGGRLVVIDPARSSFGGFGF